MARAICAAASGSIASVSEVVSNATAADGSSPDNRSVGMPATRTSSSGSSRMAKRMASDSACSRRATKARISRDSASNQCASSTVQISGVC